MKITKLVKKDIRTIVISFDTDEVLFLAYEVLLKNGLRKGDEITQDRFSFLVRENQKYFIKHKAVDLLARRIHSSKELKMKLLQKKYDVELIEEVLKNLEESGLLSDEKFAEQYAEEKLRLKKWGSNKLKSELFKKGVDRQIVDKIVNVNFPEGNDTEMAILLAKKKVNAASFKSLSKEKQKARLFSFLAARGYDFETIKHAAEQLLEN